QRSLHHATATEPHVARGARVPLTVQERGEPNEPPCPQRVEAGSQAIHAGARTGAADGTDGSGVARSAQQRLAAVVPVSSLALIQQGGVVGFGTGLTSNGERAGVGC